ncbi:MAG: CinA family nicotinamide mononucleotide deamidase-related protein, partial [bacterium]
MRSKLITIGDEILIGQIINTNASFIGERLFSIGIPLEKTVVIGDNEKILLSEFKDSFDNYDVTIITGGLGPTHDDITKPALVKFFNDELITDDKVLEYVKKIFSSRNLVMPEVNIGQALIPKNSRVIWNHNGTAPGIWIEKDDKIFIAMPGVPYEMKAMFDNEIIPDLKMKFAEKKKSVLLQKTLLTTGIGESALSERLGNLNDLLAESKLAFLPSSWGVRLRINAEGKNETEAEEKISRIEGMVRAKAEDFIYGVNDEKLEEIVVKILKERNSTLSVAESCTGGRISSTIVSVAGSSKCYLGGICAYSNLE